MQGRIIKGVGGLYLVAPNDEKDIKLYTCTARGLFRYQKIKPAIGDYVEIEEDTGDGKPDRASIVKILPLYVASHEMCQITRDHSYVEEMVSMGKMTRDSDEYRLRKNIITRAIGSPSGVTVDYFEIELSHGNQVILCSDGLTNMVSDDEIFQVLSREISLRSKCEQLIGAANKCSFASYEPRI